MKIHQIWSINDSQSCWEWQSFDQFMIETEALSSLSENTILLIYQLSVFSRTDHWFIQIIISQFNEILQFIIEHYADFFSAWYSLLVKFITHKERSVRLDSANLQASWFLDDERFKIRKIQIDFFMITAHIFEHLFYLDWWRSQFSLFIQASSSSFFIIIIIILLLLFFFFN